MQMLVRQNSTYFGRFIPKLFAVLYMLLRPINKDAYFPAVGFVVLTHFFSVLNVVVLLAPITGHFFTKPMALCVMVVFLITAYRYYNRKNFFAKMRAYLQLKPISQAFVVLYSLVYMVCTWLFNIYPFGTLYAHNQSSSYSSRTVIFAVLFFEVVLNAPPYE